MNTNEYVRMKQKVERLQKEVSRAEGAFDQLMGRLQDEFGCSSLEEGTVELEKREKRLKQLEEKQAKTLEEFEAKWGEVLSGVE